MTKITRFNYSNASALHKGSLLSKAWSFLYILLIISVSLENFKLFDVMGAAIKVTHLVFIAGIVLGIISNGISPKKLLLGFAFLALPLFPLYRVQDLIEWTKSYTIYCLIVIFSLLSFDSFVEEHKRRPRFYTCLFLWVLIICELLGIIQFIFVNFFGIQFLKGFFGVFEFHYCMTSTASNGFVRSYSLFHEPSVLGWVTIVTSVVVVLYRPFFKSKLTFWLLMAINVVSIIVSLSFLAMLEFLIILFVYQLIKTKNAAVNILSILAFFVVVLFLYQQTNILDSLGRIKEIGIENSSGYERFVSPYKYVVATFQNYPLFGRGLGQEGPIDSVGVIGLYEGVNNSVFGVLVNFGLTGLFFVGLFFFVFTKKIKKNLMWLFVFATLFFIYLSTGAYISLDTYVFVVLLMSVGGACLSKKAVIKHGNRSAEPSI